MKRIHKEWLIIGGVGLLSITMLVGVILLITGGHRSETPHPTTGIQLEGTQDPQQDTINQTTRPDGKPVATAPDVTDGTTGETVDSTTAPETTGDGVQNSDPTEDGTTSATGDGQEDDANGIGFGDAPPQSPSGPTTPTSGTKPPVEETEPIPTETMDPEKPVKEYTYKEYMALAPSEKTAFFYKFPSLSAFNQWYNAAKKAYDDEKLVIGDGNIDLEELMETTP